MCLRGKRGEISGLLAGELDIEEEAEELRWGGASVPMSVFGSLLTKVGSITAADMELKLSSGCEVVGFKVGDVDSGGWCVRGKGW